MIVELGDIPNDRWSSIVVFFTSLFCFRGSWWRHLWRRNER